MESKIRAVLERELAKLDRDSTSSPDPLPIAAIKSLDTLIRAYRSFIDPADKPAQPASQDPALLTSEQLIQALNDDQPG